jgi:hypothetical protein
MFDNHWHKIAADNFTFSDIVGGNFFCRRKLRGLQFAFTSNTYKLIFFHVLGVHATFKRWVCVNVTLVLSIKIVGMTFSK